MSNVKILTVSDIHGYVDYVAKASLPISDVDAVLLSGDLTHFGVKDDAENVIDAFTNYNKNVYAISGNCDYPQVDEYLTEIGINLHGKVTNIMGVNIIGINGSLATPSKTPGEYTEEYFKTTLKEVEKKYPKNSPVILLSHQPPHNTLCDSIGSMHTGCKLLRTFIEQYQPLACFCGHIHEASGIDQIGRTYIMNPGPFREGGAILAEVNLKERNAEFSFIDLFKI